MSTLEDWGWTQDFETDFEACRARFDHPERLIPARVVALSREIYRVRTTTGERVARPSGRLRASSELPAIGDWSVVEAPSGGGDCIIHCLLPRRTRLSRKVAGERTEEQVVAANVDAVFLIMGLDGDYNLRRLERFAVMAWNSGADPVVVLTKADLVEDPLERRFDAEDMAPGVPVHVTAAVHGEGLDPLRGHLGPGCTVALIGSSGAGKSTLLNALCGGEVMATGAVREGDDRGRHTTTHRQLVRLPSGGLLIDNPGVREIQLWADSDAALDDAFDDVAELASACRFRNCSHVDEPGCAVLEAVEAGALSAGRLGSYRGLRRELRHLELKQDVAAQRRESKKTGKLYRSIQNAKRLRKGM